MFGLCLAIQNKSILFNVHSIKRILRVSTLLCSDHSVAETRELEFTKDILQAVIDGLSKSWYNILNMLENNIHINMYA